MILHYACDQCGHREATIFSTYTHNVYCTECWDWITMSDLKSELLIGEGNPKQFEL